MSKPFVKVRTTLGLDDIVQWGNKYRGSTVRAIIAIDPAYIKKILTFPNFLYLDTEALNYLDACYATYVKDVVARDKERKIALANRLRKELGYYPSDFTDEDFGDWYDQSDFF